MPDDLERRLRADAARQPVVEAPPLARAVARAARRSRPVVASVAVAASVVLVGGVAAVLANDGSGGGGGSAAGDAGGYRLRGLLQEDSVSEPDVVTVLLDIGSCTTNSGKLSVRVISESSTAVYIGIGAASAPSAGAAITAINDIGSVDVGPPEQVISPAVPPDNPSGGSTDLPSTGGPTHAPATQDVCSWHQIDGGKVHLAAPPGTRKFYVDDRAMIVLDGQFPSGSTFLPAGYHQLEADTPENDRLVGFARGTDDAGDIVGVDYGPPLFIPTPGTVIGHADVNGHPATLTEAPGVRAIWWLLDSGARVRLYSLAPTPLSASELEASARRLH